MKDITVIVPVHNVTGNFNEWFEKAIKSIKEQKSIPGKILLVHCVCPGVKERLETFDYGDLNYEIIENPGAPDFASQVNYGVSQTETKWFSVLEFDDEYSNIWFKNVEEYINSYPEVGLFLPLVVETSEKGEFLGFTNEAVWAMNFSEKLGHLDNSVLLNFQNFQTSGMVMDKETYEEIGGIKPNIVLSFVYEFLLRATYNDVKVMTVPKVGYRHTNMREDSLFWTYKNSEKHRLEPEVAKFWIDAAKKEYFFKNDRQITYTEGHKVV